MPLVSYCVARARVTSTFSSLMVLDIYALTACMDHKIHAACGYIKLTVNIEFLRGSTKMGHIILLAIFALLPRAEWTVASSK